MKTKNCYFRILLLFLGFSFPFFSFGQLIVDAGKDTTYCTGKGKMYLGTSVTIKNGVEPYSFTWECKVPGGGLHPFYTASDLLSDSTAISPIIIGVPISNEWINFTLHVTDSQNNSAKDIIRVRISAFFYLLGYDVVQLEKGDSILFNESSVGGGIEPLKFQWQPTTGLSNPDQLVTWCKTDSLTEYITDYNIVAIDSCGCISNPNLVYEVRIIQTGFNELKEDYSNLLHIRQEGTTVYFDNPFKQKAHVALYTINGALCHSFDIADDHLEIANQLKNKGVYLIRISVGKLTGNSKIINL